MLFAVRIVEFLGSIKTYLMTVIPKLFNTVDMIDYLPHGPPDSSDDESDVDEPEPVEPKKEPDDEIDACAALGSTQENWQVVDETKKSRGVVRLVKWIFRRNP